MKKTLMTICAFIMLMVAFSVTSISSEAKVKLNKKTAEVKVGSTVTLKVSGTKKKVKWTTGNKKVATVKAKGKYKGIVTGKKAGKTTITAKVSGKKYKCKLTVASKPAGDDTEKKSEVVEPTEDDTEKKSEVVEPTEDTAKVDAGEYSLDNVHSGKGTYYERVSGGAANGMGAGPYTFRVTDFYGHQLIDSGIEINTTSTPVNGAANFPY